MVLTSDFEMSALRALFIGSLLLFVSGISNYSTDNRFQRCFDEGESYAASFLTSIKHFSSRDLTYRGKISTELASFIVLETRHGWKRKSDAIGQMVRTRDMMDFAVIHISTMERTHRMLAKSIQPINLKLKGIAKNQREYAMGQPYPATSNHAETLVIMPFVGTRHSLDAGNSAVANRRLYLEVCFWNIIQIYRNIVIGCCFLDDVEMIREELKLPAFEVLLLSECTGKPHELPHALLRATQVRLKETSSKWKDQFKYIFYTESDQMLVSRELDELYKYVDKYPYRVLLPHRLIPYTAEVLVDTFRSSGIERRLPQLVSHDSLSPWRCCLPASACSGNRTGLTALKKAMRSSTAPMLNIAGLFVVMGTSNFIYHRFRFCQFVRKESGLCPSTLFW